MSASEAMPRRVSANFGWHVVAAVFVLAMFGWGVGFYGPPIFLHTVQATRGWSLALVSGAVTMHFLFGALVVASLPRLHARFGKPAVTSVGCTCLAFGALGWAIAAEPWQLYVAALMTGGGWVTMSAAAVNAIVAPWFAKRRAAALAMAYNGASVGGVIFSSLWVVSIEGLGFPGATIAIGAVMVVTIVILARLYFAPTPASVGLTVDGGEAGTRPPAPSTPPAPLRTAIWRDRRFVTLTTAMALGLIAQIGLLAHLFSLLVPALGTRGAGLAGTAATAAAVVGRTVFGWMMTETSNRRLFLAATYAVQAVGSLAFFMAGGASLPLLLAGVVLFGWGIGNATSLPPTIAQADFEGPDATRAVPLMIAVVQALFTFAPMAFALLREIDPSATAAGSAPLFFLTAAGLQIAAIVAVLAARN